MSMKRSYWEIYELASCCIFGNVAVIRISGKMALDRVLGIVIVMRSNENACPCTAFNEL
jgi:hypothetical protein